MVHLNNPTRIDQYILDGHNSVLSLRNFYDTILVTDDDSRDHISRIPIGDFFLNYRNELKDIVQAYTLSDMHFYRPKSLSLELYGTTEMWLSLMRINEFRSIIEFDLPVIKIYNPTAVRELISIFFKREGKIT